MEFYFEKSICVSAPINIALVKYWGKEDEEQIIPKNNSISLTLDKNKLKSVTYLKISTNLTENKIFVNNKQSKINSRILTMFKYALNKSEISGLFHEKLRLEIKSTNNFPTAAGMASSASGMAALAFALGTILSLSMEDVSILARLGSGSATRSVYGGIVEWAVMSGDGESRATQLYNENYWPELRILICVVTGAEKKVPSTAGMQTSVKTSQLIKYRFEHCVEENLKMLRLALDRKDFAGLAAVTMRESNQLHAICLDTVPAVVYLNSASFQIMDFVHVVNETFDSPRLAYTFDAGPNAFLVFEERSEGLVLNLLDFAFGTEVAGHKTVPQSDAGKCEVLFTKLSRCSGLIQSTISSNVGSGPEECLQD